MQFLRANTQVIVTVGPFVDVGDGFTPQTDIALSGNEAELIKHGSTTVVDISGATWAAVTNCRGYYSLTLTTSHTDTEGMLVVVVQDDSDCLPVKQEYMVLAESAWDSLLVAKDDGFMDVNIKTVGRTDTQETEANNLESACSNYSVTRGLTGTAVPAAVADAAGGLMISDDGGWDADELYDAIVTDAAGANIAADIIAMQGNVTDVLTDTGTTLPAEHAALPTAVENRTEIDSNSTQLAAILTDTGTTLPAEHAALPTAAENRAELDSNSTQLAAILTDTAEIGAAGAGLTAIWDIASAITLDFGTLAERTYQMLNNEENITNADGSVALRNLADNADMATGSITDNDTTTSRAAFSWA